MRVLVTGASGFIGRFVLAELARRGVEAVASARHARPDIADVEWIASDLLHPGACDALLRAAAPTHLVHLAWYAAPGLFWRAPENLDWAAATIQLVRAFAARGGQGAMFGGTCAEYGWDRPVLSETDRPAPATFYGRVKDATRAAVVAAADEFGIPCGWGRVFWLYGPHEAAGRLISDASACLLRGEEIACSEGQQRRDFLHVEDVAAAFVAGVLNGWSGPLNIGSGQAVAVRDVLEAIGKLTDRCELIRFGARPTTPGEPPELAADTALLRNRLGFLPQYTLDDGLAATVAWWRARTEPLHSAPQRAASADRSIARSC